MATLIVFLRNGKGGSQPSPVPPVCYKAVDGSKEEDSVNGRSGHLDVFCKKKCSSKFSSIHKEIPALESFLNTVTGLQPATLSEKKLRYRCFHESFAKFL